MNILNKVYLDNNATTALDPRVLSVVTDALENLFGNPSSAHTLGQVVRQKVNQARRTIASHLGVRPQEVIFTSGGTEGLNTVLKGFWQQQPRAHVVSSTVEHACVYATLRELSSAGQEISFLSPGLHGAVTPEAVKEAIQPHTGLICLMAVNNETGVKTDIPAIAAVAHEARIPFVVDAVAWLGKEAVTIPQGVSALCFSGHKFHAPKGVGFLVLRSQLKIPPLLTGGGQEFGKRGGTENVSGILGMAEAIRLLETELPEATNRMRRLRDRLQQGILAEIPDAQMNGSGPRVANTLNLSFPGIDGESLLVALDQAGLAISHGSACASGALEPSRILIEMGIPESIARGAMRFSLSRFTTEGEIDRAIQIVVAQVKR